VNTIIFQIYTLSYEIFKLLREGIFNVYFNSLYFYQALQHKAVPVLNQLSCHEDVWGRWRNSSTILDLGTQLHDQAVLPPSERVPGWVSKTVWTTRSREMSIVLAWNRTQSYPGSNAFNKMQRVGIFLICSYLSNSHYSIRLLIP
jgi:hypothetical protein